MADYEKNKLNLIEKKETLENENKDLKKMLAETKEKLDAEFKNLRE